MALSPNELEKPAGSAGKPPEETAIHVIPKEFYGAAVPAKRPAAAPPAPVVVTPAASPPPSSTSAASAAKKKGSAVTLIAAVVIFLLLGAGGGYYYFFMRQPVVTPAGPTCGDLKCEGGETVASCPADCQPPAPVCGDLKCEGGETSSSCSSDCGAPTPTCGDLKCEGGETVASCLADCQPPAPVCGDDKCEEGESAADCPDDCRLPEPTAGLDTDSDGLTDREETEIYGTATRAADSDGDNFVDLNEPVNLHNPAKPSPSKLTANPGIAAYENAVQKYSLLRPSSWTVRDGDEIKSEVFISAADGEFIEVLVLPKPKATALLDWYLAQAPGVAAADVTMLKTKQGRVALQAPDKLTSYVDVGNRVIVVSYNLGKQDEMQYRATFLMMVQSVRAEEMAELKLPAPSSAAQAAPAENAAEAVTESETAEPGR
jgi:hypothetical protein